jgi:hypothetical protein
MRERRGATQFWWGNRMEKRPLGRPWDRWKDDISGYSGNRLGEVVHCVYLSQGEKNWRGVVNTVTNIRVPENVENFLIR